MDQAITDNKKNIKYKDSKGETILKATEYLPYIKKGTESGVKHDTGKLRYDLYPTDAYKGCTKVITFGAEKYTPNGWKDVKPKSRYYAALMRHLLAQIEYEDNGGTGLALDEESGLPHLDHAQCCLIFYREITNKEKQAIKQK